jgi:hypothetical protein
MEAGLPILSICTIIKLFMHGYLTLLLFVVANLARVGFMC